MSSFLYKKIWHGISIHTRKCIPGKVNVNQVLAMDQKDIDTFNELKKLGVKFDVRKVPSSSPENMDNLLKKAQDLVNQGN